MTTRSRSGQPRRFIEYARVSKVGERDPEELKSPQIQINAMDAYAKRHNIEVIDRVIDLDKSGRTFEQRAIKDIIARIKNGKNGAMPAFDTTFTDVQVDEIIKYIRELKPHEG
jgi:hypothetical protein